MISTKFTEEHIRGTSKKITNTKGITDKFDLLIFPVGWESRCTEITKYDIGDFHFDSAIILSLELDGDKGYLDEYFESVKSFVENKIDECNVEYISGNPNEFINVGRKLEEIISMHVKNLNRPINIGFDISSCPRYFYLHLLGFCLKNDITKKLTFFYSEGNYHADTIHFIHTEGDWEIIEMTEFKSNYNPEYKNFYIISAGFEGSRYRSVVAKYEPDMLGILLPEPGFKDEYTQKTKKECEILKEQFYIPENNIVKASAGDAIAAWEALNNPSLNRNDCNITYLTVGPKPHVLAMGIHGFLNENIIVTYRIPQGYTRMEVEAAGNFWQYDIENMIFI